MNNLIKVLDCQPSPEEVFNLSVGKCILHGFRKGYMAGVFCISNTASMHFYNNKFVLYYHCKECHEALVLAEAKGDKTQIGKTEYKIKEILKSRLH